MQGEREGLRRAVFPIVREACEQRGIAFFEIDLRWGVTRAEAESGRVLAICLEEIDRSAFSAGHDRRQIRLDRSCRRSPPRGQ